MDELREEYYGDIREKNLIARSARSSHATPLTSSGNVETDPPEKVCYTKLLTWKEIKALRPCLRKKYLEMIMKHYGIGPTQIAHALGISRSAVSSEAKRLGCEYKKYAGQENEKAFLDAVNGQQVAEGAEVVEIHHEAQKEPLQANLDALQGKPEPKPRMTMSSSTLELYGPFNPQQIADTLSRVWPEGDKVRIIIKIEEDRF